tara:strand:- start:112 stop:225 length:114 start_codon:yes stop_codon:yes gene_type:complete
MAKKEEPQKPLYPSWAESFKAEILEAVKDEIKKSKSK